MPFFFGQADPVNLYISSTRPNNSKTEPACIRLQLSNKIAMQHWKNKEFYKNYEVSKKEKK